MKHASALRSIFALAIVASPLAVIACSTPDTHPPIIGDCTGANCTAGGSAGGSGTGAGSSDGSTTTTGDGSTGTGDDGGSVSDGGSTTGSE